MNVMDVSNAAGITAGEAIGTIDEQNVLAALATLAAIDPDNADLFAQAARAVENARSAGVEHVELGRVAGTGGQTRMQLRYRSEMAEIFTDLAIDVGLRDLDKTPAV